MREGLGVQWVRGERTVGRITNKLDLGAVQPLGEPVFRQGERSILVGNGFLEIGDGRTLRCEL